MKKEDLILVIDMQKVYTAGGPWACGNVKRAAGSISKLLDRVIDLEDKAPSAMLTRFIAADMDDASGVWSEYNDVNREINEDPVMNEFIPEIARYVEEFPYFDKCTYSCFSQPYVRAAGDKAMVHGGDIVLTGVVAECCVLSTFFQGADLGYHFIYLTDACAGLDDETEAAVLKVLQGLSPLHVEFMTTEEYLK
ncbi:cysteine hydrolase family protein [Oribacterium sp. P6A1]|uniref:cysteine hydrolase family protein n=1 Tax=Oribacterium sp. P6A1 TaxID=1410612 RepID=UPI000690ED87|nr:isochorismatase family protein [Oribacterium sp. P6A1]